MILSRESPETVHTTNPRLNLPQSRTTSDRVAAAMMWCIVISVSTMFLWIVGDLVRHGIGQLSLQFLTSEPLKAGRAGGILPIVISTLLILLVALIVAVPLGLCCAVWLAEFTRTRSALSIFVGRSLDVLASVPSIVFGLFGNALFCNLLGLGYSILAGGLTLACMVLPILIRSLEAGLRAVPNEYRLAAAALGMSRTRTVLSILLPCAVPGLIVGLVLGAGRVLAETAALLFTSGYSSRMPRGVMDSGRALSVHIYDLSMNVPGGEPNAYASALVLVAMLLVINATATWATDRWLRQEVVPNP